MNETVPQDVDYTKKKQEQSKAYYQKNRQLLLAKASHRYQQNPEPAMTRARKRYSLKKDEILAYSKTYNSDPRRRLIVRLRKYSLTVDEYNALLEIQNWKCRICREEFTETPNIDHNHETGEVRGLLCSPCNFIIV